MKNKNYYFNADGSAFTDLTASERTSVKKDFFYNEQIKVYSLDDGKELAKGKVKSIENGKLTLTQPNGIEQVYDILSIIVQLLPLIESIVMFFRRIFTKKIQ